LGLHPLLTGRFPAPTVGGRHPQPVVAPDRNVRDLKACCSISARLGLPGFVTDGGTPRYPDGYPDYIINHERGPGIGSLAGYRGARGQDYGRGAPNPRQLESYVANGCFHEHELAPEQRYYKHANKAYLDWAKEMGFIGEAAPITFQLYLELLQKFRYRRGGTKRRPPAIASGSPNSSIRSRSGTRRSITTRARANNFRFRPSRKGRCTCTTRGDRTMPGCGRSRRRTAST
jgi:hypothetical protein